MTEPLTAGDGEHDAWLREALRHAPDASLAAPAEVRDAILLQARAAAAVPAWPEASRRTGRDAAPWAALWSWLARPPVAAGFASVMAATLVGLMWWDRPMDEALPQPPVAGAESPRPLPAAPASLPALAAAPPPPAAAADALPPRPAVVVEAARRRAVAAAPVEAKEEQRADRSANTSLSESILADNAIQKQRQVRQPEASDSIDKLAAAIEKDQAAPRADRERGVAMAKNETAATAAAAAPAPAGAMAKSPRPSTVAPSPAQTAPQPFADNRTAAADDALPRWIADVDAAVAGRWERVDPPALRRDEATAFSRPSNGGLRVQLAGLPAGVLRIDGTKLRFESIGETPPRTWQAELPAAVAERLRATMPRQPR
ncbi:MAG: hypothetical protein ABIO71_00175 [Caldimonas sp.]